jgi:ribonuclease VapC
MIVLDASALLAFVLREPGHEKVSPVLHACCMSAVNLLEILRRVARDGHNPTHAHERLRESPIEFVPFDEVQAIAATALMVEGLRLGLSLGDLACLGLGLVRDLPVLTADRAWLRINEPAPKIECIR